MYYSLKLTPSMPYKTELIERFGPYILALLTAIVGWFGKAFYGRYQRRSEHIMFITRVNKQLEDMTLKNFELHSKYDARFEKLQDENEEIRKRLEECIDLNELIIGDDED